MANFLRNDDLLETCPYNPIHKVKKCRLQAHIAKCRKIYEEEERKICPFNAQHRVAAPEYHHHLQTCPNRDIADRKITMYKEEEKIETPQSSGLEIQGSGENWDNEILPYAAPGYDPKKSRKKIIFQDTSGLYPAEKKKLYRSLHNANDEEVEEPEKENKVEPRWTLKQIRQPTMKPEVMKFRSSEVQSSSLGLGRGQPSGNPRIAANIYGLSKPKDDSVVPPNCLGRGIGRGFQINQG